jgi:predicted dehydrogenase
MRKTGRAAVTGRTFGVLVHGAGWVSSQHLAAYARNPATRVLAVSSRSLDSARRRAAEAGLKNVACYDDLDRALAHPGVDIVSVCTPQHVHAAHVLAAARAGKHLVIEKPVAIRLDELRRMRDAVRRAGVKTVVSFVLRWNPLFRRIKSMLASGALGKPYYVEADYISHNGSWWSGWNDARTVKQGVSAMLVGGCHAVDALRWFAATGEHEAARPVEVFAVSGGWRKGSRRAYDPTTHTWIDGDPPMEYDGLEVALVRFENGAIGKISVNADGVMPYAFPVRIFGDRGSVIDHRAWTPTGTGTAAWAEIPGIRPDSSDVSHHPFQGEIDHFVDCLLHGVESHCNLEDAILTHELVFAAQRCYRTGRPVRLPLIAPARRR